MIWITTFLIMTLIEVIYVSIQWSKIKDLMDISKLANNLLGATLKDNPHYKKALGIKGRIAFMIMNFKGLIWLPISILILVNMMVATLVSIILNLVLIFI